MKTKLIKARYAAPTDSNGGRVVLTDTFVGTGKKTITIDYDHRLRSVQEMARVELVRRGAKIVCDGETNSSYFFAVEFPFNFY